MKRYVWFYAIIMALVFALSANAETTEGIGATSGTCGNSLTWELDSEGTLTVSGTGAMANYNSSAGTPWEMTDGWTAIRLLHKTIENKRERR